MPLSVLDLFEYDHFILRKFLEKTRALPWDDITRNREISWNSIRNVLLHIAECEDWWFHHYIAGCAKDWKPWQYDKCDSFDSMEKRILEVQDKTRRFLQSLGKEELNTELEVKGRISGTMVRCTVEDLIFHVGTEEIYHLGEIIGVLWQDGIEPPPVGYVFSYLRTRKAENQESFPPAGSGT